MARVIPVKEGVRFTVVKTSMMSDPTHFMLAARTVEAMARVIPVKEGVSFTENQYDVRPYTLHVGS